MKETMAETETPENSPGEVRAEERTEESADCRSGGSGTGNAGTGRTASGGSVTGGMSDRASADASAAGSGSDRTAAGASAADGAEALREELSRVQERVTQLERERVLLSQGVPEEDLDYYVFKIGKLVSSDRDFDKAAKEYLKQHAVQHRGSAPLSTGASLSGRAARIQSTNDTMNRLLRGA